MRLPSMGFLGPRRTGLVVAGTPFFNLARGSRGDLERGVSGNARKTYVKRSAAGKQYLRGRHTGEESEGGRKPQATLRAASPRNERSRRATQRRNRPRQFSEQNASRIRKAGRSIEVKPVEKNPADKRTTSNSRGRQRASPKRAVAVFFTAPVFLRPSRCGLVIGSAVGR